MKKLWLSRLLCALLTLVLAAPAYAGELPAVSAQEPAAQESPAAETPAAETPAPQAPAAPQLLGCGFGPSACLVT